jgi:hypothetical protein
MKWGGRLIHSFEILQSDRASKMYSIYQDTLFWESSGIRVKHPIMSGVVTATAGLLEPGVTSHALTGTGNYKLRNAAKLWGDIRYILFRQNLHLRRKSFAEIK